MNRQRRPPTSQRRRDARERPGGVLQRRHLGAGRPTHLYWDPAFADVKLAQAEAHHSSSCFCLSLDVASQVPRVAAST